MKSQNKKSKLKKWSLILLVLLVPVALVVGYRAYTSDSNQAKGADDNATTTSTAATAQEDFTDGQPREALTTSNDEGTITDNRGNVGDIPSQDLWQKSIDGKITVYSPNPNNIISNGGSISGESSYSQVYFRLIDDVSGVISEGTLLVVNNKFSGTFNFSTSGSNGRLDVYSARSDGVEVSNVEIPVKFR